MTKAEKAEYDKKYRERKKEEIRLKKKLYNESPAGREMQKRQREKRKQYHNEFSRQSEQREKEKIRRYKRGNLVDKTKYCIVCNTTKFILDFEFSDVYKDNRQHCCKECEKKHKELGCSTTNVIQAIVARCDYRLSRYDVAEHPYLIEANRYLILLKHLVK